MRIYSHERCKGIHAMQISDMATSKKNLREKYKTIRTSMSTAEKKRMDQEILKLFFSLSEYKKTKLILTYVSKEKEIDTFKLIKVALNDGKIIGVPKCNSKQKKISFYEIKSIEELKPSIFGILEPINCIKLSIDISKDTLCVVPGLCFDANGYRVGYGHGYYDRYLKNFVGISIGVCYNNCVVDKILHENFDKNVNMIITDKYIKKIGIYNPTIIESSGK